MKLRVDFSLSKRTRVRLALRLGLDEGAAVDLKLRLPGREPVRWKAALAPGGKPPPKPALPGRKQDAPERKREPIERKQEPERKPAPLERTSAREPSEPDATPATSPLAPGFPPRQP
jgi:hypothetical protein